VRDVPGLKKKPSTSELLDWIKLLLNEDVDPETLRQQDSAKLIPPLHGALLKNEQDVHLFERLAFMARVWSVRLSSARRFRPKRTQAGRATSAASAISPDCAAPT
jgi:MoxR-like ATPase